MIDIKNKSDCDVFFRRLIRFIFKNITPVSIYFMYATLISKLFSMLCYSVVLFSRLLTYLFYRLALSFDQIAWPNCSFIIIYLKSVTMMSIPNCSRSISPAFRYSCNRCYAVSYLTRMINVRNFHNLHIKYHISHVIEHMW